MQLSSATWCRRWLTMTINHCLRTSLHQLMKHQMPHNVFSNWEHSGNCYCCLEGGRKNKACLSFNSEVKPTIKQLFVNVFFSRILSWKLSYPQTISTYNVINIGPPPMESSFIGWVSGVPHGNNQWSRSS